MKKKKMDVGLVTWIVGTICSTVLGIIVASIMGWKHLTIELWTEREVMAINENSVMACLTIAMVGVAITTIYCINKYTAGIDDVPNKNSINAE